MISDTLKFFLRTPPTRPQSYQKYYMFRNQPEDYLLSDKWTSHFYHIQDNNSFSIQITTAIYMEYYFLRYGNSFCHFSSAFRQIKLNIRTSFKYYIRSLIILKKLATIAGFCFVVLTQYIFSILVPQKQLRYLDILCFRYGNKIAG